MEPPREEVEVVEVKKEQSTSETVVELETKPEEVKQVEEPEPRDSFRTVGRMTVDGEGL